MFDKLIHYQVTIKHEKDQKILMSTVLLDLLKIDKYICRHL